MLTDMLLRASADSTDHRLQAARYLIATKRGTENTDTPSARRWAPLVELAAVDDLNPEVYRKLLTHPVPEVRAAAWARGDEDVLGVREMLAVETNTEVRLAALAYADQLDDQTVRDVLFAGGRRGAAMAFAHQDRLDCDTLLSLITQHAESDLPMAAAITRDDLAPQVATKHDLPLEVRLTACHNPVVCEQTVIEVLQSVSRHAVGTGRRERITKMLQARGCVSAELLNHAAQVYTCGGTQRFVTEAWVQLALANPGAPVDLLLHLLIGFSAGPTTPATATDSAVAQWQEHLAQLWGTSEPEQQCEALGYVLLHPWTSDAVLDAAHRLIRDTGADPVAAMIAVSETHGMPARLPRRLAQFPAFLAAWTCPRSARRFAGERAAQLVAELLSADPDAVLAFHDALVQLLVDDARTQEPHQHSRAWQAVDEHLPLSSEHLARMPVATLAKFYSTSAGADRLDARFRPLLGSLLTDDLDSAEQGIEVLRAAEKVPGVSIADLRAILEVTSAPEPA